ncbi:MAG: SAM-dependent methyltransferase [Planctomycetota bacterium]
MTDPSPADRQFVSRGGLKLDAALDAFAVDARGQTCADLGCSTGGFVDCLLQRGAARVFAVDTAYGELAWKLRQDERVVVLERTNALHAPPPPDAQGRCDLVTLDLGWTKQDKALPAVLPWLADGGTVVTLIKPHYESGQHRLSDEKAKRITDEVVARFPEWGWALRGLKPSAVRGGKGKNLEYLACLERTR